MSATPYPNMIKGLEPLYGPQPWSKHTRLLPDPYDRTAHGYVYHPAFGGAMEVQAAAALYWQVLAAAKAHRGDAFAVVETGTADGFSTCFIARALEDAGKGHVWTCEYDPTRQGDTGPEPRPWPALWARLGLDHRIYGILGNTTRATTWDAPEQIVSMELIDAKNARTVTAPAPALPDEIDILFLDSEHTMETIGGEWRALAPRLTRRGGLLLMHDVLIFSEVAQALDVICAEIDCGEPQYLDSCRGLVAVTVPGGRT